MHALPDIEVSIVEYSEAEHNIKNGIDRGPTAVKTDENGNAYNEGPPVAVTVGNKKRKSVDVTGKEKDQMYYSVSCKDNGCGIPEAAIGDMLGRVLSGSKHGVRQTRGKFGLGAKMALIWSKKSSGLPITVRTAHSTSLDRIPATVTTIVLDIDIYKNEPKIISSKTALNKAGWRGVYLYMYIFIYIYM
jgi:DNA topoisomerase-6 subunit B